MKVQHPFPVDTIRQAILFQAKRNFTDGQAKSTLSDESLDKGVDAAEAILSNVQRIFQQNFRTVLSSIYTDGISTEIILNTPQYVIFAEGGTAIQSALKEELDGEKRLTEEFDMLSRWSLVTACHENYAKRQIKNHPAAELEQDNRTLYIISKERRWEEAEWTVQTLLTTLVRSGLSPTQALDYWMVKYRNVHPPNWARHRGTSSDTVRQNVNRAEKHLNQNLENQEHETYFSREYRGKKSDQETRVTVDGGPLPPRRDITADSRNGDMSWGYRGAGPRQLAVALLADALRQDEIEGGKISEFVKYINREVDNSTEWTLTEEQIKKWSSDYDKIHSTDT